jgi:hypothetical protein
MEKLIAVCPAQYFWSYNRYKRRKALQHRKPRPSHEVPDCLLWLLHWSCRCPSSAASARPSAA